MKRALVSRYGAYGDIIHVSFLPRLLKDQGFDVVDFETNFKGTQLLYNNPFIDKLLFFEPKQGSLKINMQQHWDLLSENYDTFINLYGSLEITHLAMEEDNLYYMSSAVRRNRYKNINYYDVTCAYAGYPQLVGHYLGEIFFTEEEDQIIRNIIDKYKNNFLVIINLSGTGPHKELVCAEKLAKMILKKYPEAHIITTGGNEYKDKDFKLNRTTSIVGKFPFRQAAHLTKYADCVIGCESGLMCASNLFGTPTVQIMTAANLVSHCKYAHNNFSIQSTAYCSPCFKGPYSYRGCPHKDGKPLCALVSPDLIMEQVDKTYELKRKGYQRTYA